MILGGEDWNPEISSSSSSHKWRVVTKYYKAEVMLKTVDHDDVLNDAEDFSETEAVVFYCDTTKDNLAKADKVWLKIKESCPAVCLFVVETASDDVKDKKEATRTQILDWCLSNQFELVECDEEDDDVGDSDNEEIFDEKAGRIRIIQALKAHTWSNLELIEESETSDDKEIDKTNQKTSLLEAAQENLGEDPAFEDLFSQISKMKDISNNLPNDERRAYAEKVSRQNLELKLIHIFI